MGEWWAKPFHGRELKNFPAHIEENNCRFFRAL
jgi:hypothetical protein